MNKPIKLNIDLEKLFKNHKERPPASGIRFFTCECGYSFSEKSRDCLSPSCEICPRCSDNIQPSGFEKHPEWQKDKSGNLIKEE